MRSLKALIGLHNALPPRISVPMHWLPRPGSPSGHRQYSAIDAATASGSDGRSAAPMKYGKAVEDISRDMALIETAVKQSAECAVEIKTEATRMEEQSTALAERLHRFQT